MTTAATALDQLPTRDGRLSVIVSLARTCGDVADAKARLQGDQASLIQPTINAWLEALRPLKLVEPRLDGPEAKKVKRAFLPNAAKMRPDMSEEKADLWCRTVCAALSDLPTRCIVKAADRAIHNVFEFPTQLEASIRTRAEDYWTTDRRCIEFLQRLHASLYGRQTELQDLRPAAPLSEDEVRDLVRGGPLCKALIPIGVANGSIDPLLLATIQAEEGVDA